MCPQLNQAFQAFTSTFLHTAFKSLPISLNTRLPEDNAGVLEKRIDCIDLWMCRWLLQNWRSSSFVQRHLIRKNWAKTQLTYRSPSSLCQLLRNPPTCSCIVGNAGSRSQGGVRRGLLMIGLLTPERAFDPTPAAINRYRTSRLLAVGPHGLVLDPVGERLTCACTRQWHHQRVTQPLDSSLCAVSL